MKASYEDMHSTAVLKQNKESGTSLFSLVLSPSFFSLNFSVHYRFSHLFPFVERD